MNYLSVENLSKSYNEKVLFENLTFGISRGEKVALVAKNGAGKSTLLNILTGLDTPEKGMFTFRKEITMAYLSQNPDLDESKTIIENVFTGNSPLLKAISDYELSLLEFEHNHDAQSTERLEKATEEMNVLNAWDYEYKIKQILSQLNINDLEQSVSTLSGGQKKRVALSKVLIQEPDMLIMDEPTNHLDLEMIEWLEEHLSGKNITLFLVTHDRYFLDRVCNKILELDAGKLYQYNGNYSYFVEKKAEREMMEASELEKTKNTFRRELEWVRRMPKARTTKSKSRLDAFDTLEEKAKGKGTQEALQLNVKTTRMGSKILEMIKLNKAYGDLTILKDFNYVFKRHEKIGIIGKNGIGKTTFLNMIMGFEQPDSGKIQTGETIVFGYYSQEGMVMNEDKRVIELIKDIAEFIPLADGTKLSASQLLLRFQFTPEVQYNFVSKLSGGEKRRLYLMTLLIKNPNFLILDEPTNDLDIATLSILEDFLFEFQGCVIIVSHDRYFMDKLVDHVFVFEGNGVIKDYPGNYSDYRNWFDENKRIELAAAKLAAQNPAPKAEVKVVETASQKRKLTFKEKFELENLDKEIPELETQKKELEQKIMDSSLSHTDIYETSKKIEQITEELDSKGLRWLELSELS